VLLSTNKWTFHSTATTVSCFYLTGIGLLKIVPKSYYTSAFSRRWDSNSSDSPSGIWILPIERIEEILNMMYSFVESQIVVSRSEINARKWSYQRIFIVAILGAFVFESFNMMTGFQYSGSPNLVDWWGYLLILSVGVTTTVSALEICTHQQAKSFCLSVPSDLYPAVW